MAQIYLNNKDFFQEIVKCKEKDVLTREAEEMFILLANRTIKKMRYSNPSDRDDCLQTGLLIMFMNWRNFDPEKSTNAFSYFTEVFKRGMARGYNELYKIRGVDTNVKCISIQSSNDGDGVYNL